MTRNVIVSGLIELLFAAAAPGRDRENHMGRPAELSTTPLMHHRKKNPGGGVGLFDMERRKTMLPGGR